MAESTQYEWGLERLWEEEAKALAEERSSAISEVQILIKDLAAEVERQQMDIFFKRMTVAEVERRLASAREELAKIIREM